MDFSTLVDAAQKQKPEDHRYKHILCFDPGHTTGWAYFSTAQLLACGEIDTTSILNCIENAQPLFHTHKPEIVVMEDYRIYSWRQKQHVGSEMLTTRIIGSLETQAIQDFVNHVVKQPAHVAKGFCDDRKLKEWAMYEIGQKHARDAIRHGCYYILFGSVRKEDQHGGVTVG